MSKSSRTQEHFVAPVDSDVLPETDAVQDGKAPLSMWGEAWRNLRRRPLFIISALLILLIVAVAAFPQLFTQTPPDGACYLADSNAGPSPGHPLGFTLQGCDVYARLIYGTRASLLVGIITTVSVVLLGGSLGALAGYYGGWLDAVIARLGDIFFALPLILGAIIVMQLPMFRENRNIWTVVLTLVVFGWPQIARITTGCSDLRAQRGLRRCLPGAGRLQVPGAGEARPAQRPGPGDRHGHHFAGYLHRG